MTNDGSNTLVYDGENRALSATNGSTSGTYAYDGNGLRVTKVAGGTTTVYIFAGSKVIAEYDNGAAVASPSREYIYSRAQLLAKIESGATTYFHADHLSARLLTDLSGNTLGQRGHYPFGETWYETGTTTKFKFTTYERDGESGNDYAMARFNINRLGRFSSPDPIAGSIGDPQSLNRYTYVKNYPIGFVDPSGLDCTYVSAQESQPCTVGGGIWGFSGSDFGLTGGGQPHVSLLECHVDPYCISNGGIGRFGSPVANGYSWADSTYTAGGNYRIQRPKGALVLNCEGSASDLDCFWATWSLQYVINGNQRYVGANLSNPDELRIRAIGQQTVKLAQGPMNVLTVVAGAEVVGIVGVEAGPAIYGGAKALGYAALGQYLVNAADITEGVGAFLDDLPAVASLPSLIGAGLNIIHTAACGAQNDEPWYCF